jgi:hypothetical protein
MYHLDESSWKLIFMLTLVIAALLTVGYIRQHKVLKETLKDEKAKRDHLR